MSALALLILVIWVWMTDRRTGNLTVFAVHHKLAQPFFGVPQQKTDKSFMNRPLGTTAILMISLYSHLAGAGGRADLLVTQDCGATPDDQTDDYQAIQNCLDAAKLAGGGVVYIPEGRFNISKTLEFTGDGVTLEGVGERSILAATTNYGPVIRIDNADPKTPAIHNRILDLTATRLEHGSTDIAIDIRHANFSVVDGVVVKMSATGISVGQPGGVNPIEDNYRTRISNSFILSDRTTGIGSAAIAFESAADALVENTFVEPSASGIGVAILGHSNGITIDKILSLGGKYGVYMVGDGFARLIRNSIIEAAAEQQIYIGEDSHEVSVLGCWLGNGEGLNSGPAMKGILIEPTAKFVNIQGNRFGDLPGNAIHSLGQNVTIDSNHIFNNGYGGFDSILIEDGRNVTVRSNQIAASNDACAIAIRNGAHRIIAKDNINDLGGANICTSGSGGQRIIADNIP